MTPASIADFDAAETDELVRLWRAAFEHGVGITDPHPLAQQRAYFVAEVLARTTVKVARRDGRLVGFIAADRDSVRQLHVRVDCIGQGIGTQLLDWAKSQSGGSLWLYTFERNRNACRFYEKSGFTVAARGHEPTWDLADVRYVWTAG